MGFRLTARQLATTAGFSQRLAKKNNECVKSWNFRVFPLPDGNDLTVLHRSSSTRGEDARRATCVRSFRLSRVIYRRNVIPSLASPDPPSPLRSEVHAHSRRGKNHPKLVSFAWPPRLPGHAGIGRRSATRICATVPHRSGERAALSIVVDAPINRVLLQRCL